MAAIAYDNNGNIRIPKKENKKEKIMSALSDYVNVKNYKIEIDGNTMGDSILSGEVSIGFDWAEENKKVFTKEILKSMKNNNEFTFMNRIGEFATYIQNETNYENLVPKRVIYNGRTTICKWKDGTKTVVKATKDDNPTHEHGVAMAVIRKLFPSRQEFLRLVDSGYDVIEETKKREIEKAERKEIARLEKIRIKDEKERAKAKLGEFIVKE